MNEVQTSVALPPSCRSLVAGSQLLRGVTMGRFALFSLALLSLQILFGAVGAKVRDRISPCQLALMFPFAHYWANS